MKNLKADKLYVQVFNEIRSYIVKNGLGPGDKLPTEFEMCAMLGVSRNVLRESIKALELMGTIKSVPGVGSVIQEMNMDYIFQYVFYYLVSDDSQLVSEVLDIRKKLELSYMEQAFYALTPINKLELREIFEKMQSKWSNQEFYHEEDRAFHDKLYENLNNKTLKAIFEATWNVDANFMLDEKYKFLGESIHKHQIIIESIEQNNYDDFQKAMTIHFNSGKYSANAEFNFSE